MMAVTSTVLGGGLLVAAGLYQLSPLKYACLRKCQTPLMFFARNWRKGYAAPCAWACRTDSTAWAAAGC